MQVWTCGRVAVMAAVLAWSAATAAAPRGAVIEPLGNRDRIDWTRGLIIAVGAATGDLRAPSPTVARPAARRRAMDAARARLMDRARALDLAGRTMAEVVAQDATARTRLERAVDQALVLAVDHGSDGSCVITAALPLEAVRTAASGPPRLKAADRAATTVIVDARKVLSRPGLGLALVTETGPRAAPTVFYRDLGAALRDSRLGERPVRVTATEITAAGITLAAQDPAGVDLALQTGALVVIVIGKES